MKKKIELMAPAGDFSTLMAACNAGADAVYFGLQDFSMRSGKKNFKISDIEKIKKICNSYQRKPKIYLTLNTIVFDRDVKKIESIIKKIKKKVDAVIVSDFATIKLCKKHKVPFFISTQMSVANKEAAIFFKKLGAKRVVLARELNIRQIKEIGKIKNLEIEVFIHGAMCVAISGRCFTSQFLFNKSANKGECLHPCRRSYRVEDKETGYKLELYNNTVMSAKDVCVLPFIEELKRANISSFKIEGRNRDARYVSVVVRVYREAIDNKLNTERIIFLMKELEEVFHRGFSSGFYLGKSLFTDYASVEGSAAKVYKEYVGKVTHYYPKAGVVLVKLAKEIKTKDKLVFIGKNVGVDQITVEEIEINKKRVEKAKKGDEIGIKISREVKKNTEVYVLRERNN
jgi:U32 family peptidase